MPSVRSDHSLDPLWGELARIGRLSWRERRLRALGYSRIAGVDEAGRGCFAGPVVAAAVILPFDAPVLGVDDSKKLDPEARERVARWIRATGASIGVGIVGADFIDVENILEASKQAMMDAIAALPERPDAVLVDAVNLPRLTVPVLPLIRGDSLVASIAAASIIAKTTRDALMDELHREYPWYGFSSNRGYGTPDHREAIRRHGPTPIHRLTFRGVVPSRPQALAF